MNDNVKQARRILVEGSETEKIQILRSMQEQIINGEPQEYFDLAKQFIGSSNNDMRWQSLIVIGEFIPSLQRNKEVWDLLLSYCGRDEDMQDALATVILEHLLEHQFDETFRKAAFEVLEHGSVVLVDLLRRCWAFGEAETHWHRVQELINQFRVRYPGHTV